MNIIPSLQITADALNAERVRMDVVSQNIANAQTTRDATGEAYKRKVVSFESVLQKASDRSGDLASVNVRSVRVAGVSSDNTPGQAVYNPGHPHADANGMVRMPNVEVAREMVDLISSSRAYEANLTVAKTARMMAEAAMRIGRQ
jgi:flagellar basal-body rod protein FlgC